MGVALALLMGGQMVLAEAATNQQGDVAGRQYVSEVVMKLGPVDAHGNEHEVSFSISSGDPASPPEMTFEVNCMDPDGLPLHFDVRERDVPDVWVRASQVSDRMLLISTTLCGYWRHVQENYSVGTEE